MLLRRARAAAGRVVVPSRQSAAAHVVVDAAALQQLGHLAHEQVDAASLDRHGIRLT
jgi:hypothetical protein